MKAIQITLKHAHLSALIQAFDEYQWSVDLSPELKSSRALCEEIYKLIYKKEIDKRGSEKWFKMSLKYYQAFALWHFTNIAISVFATISFERTALRIIGNQIHEQL